MTISEIYYYKHEPDIDTSNYRKHMSGNAVQRRLIDRFHARLAAVVRDQHPASVLDAGCGEGFVAETFLRAMPSISLTGFDPYEPSVKAARLRNPRGDFQVGDIYDIPFDDESFDLVCCIEVLEHLHDAPAALSELARVARKAVVLSVPHEPFFCLANAARGKNLDVTPKGSDPDHRNFWSREAFGHFVETELDVVNLTGSIPWTICVATPR